MKMTSEKLRIIERLSPYKVQYQKGVYVYSSRGKLEVVGICYFYGKSIKINVREGIYGEKEAPVDFPKFDTEIILAHVLLHEINHAMNYEAMGLEYDKIPQQEQECVAENYAVMMMLKLFGIDTKAIFDYYHQDKAESVDEILSRTILLKDAV